jgi:two-component system, LuxR family, sensor kinase FixL
VERTITEKIESQSDAACGHAASAAHFRKMYDRISGLANIGVWECDLATGALTWTDTVYDLFDLPRGSIIDRNDIVELYEPSSRRAMERMRSEAIRSGTGFALDVRIRTASGDDRWIRLTADIEQEDGKSVRIFGTKQDISVERAAQEKVQSLQTELIHVSRVSAMGAMASTLAHEVNQPLTAASNYLAAARRMAALEAEPAALSQSIDAALDSVLRAGEIVRRVRDMSGKGHPSIARCEFDQVAKEAIALTTAGMRELVVTCDIAPGSSVKGDPIQIQQVLINLIRNACESAAGKASRICISSSRRGTDLEICVADSGPGIPDEILPDIFESFVTTKPQGLGIGLSISRTIIEAHGGRITASNLPEGGASICFSLPLHPAARALEGGRGRHC